jgi:XTP/dITP diphosphohydrolase
MEKIVLASSNAGKLREFAALLAPLGLTVVTQSELGVASADEPHDTFVENALAKARHASAATGLPALADDSGICAPALGGAPGVHSAHYAGPARDDVANNAKLAGALSGHLDQRVFYYCALVFVRRAQDPTPIIATADWWGLWVAEPAGRQGFGYDPHFFLGDRGMTAAELPVEAKNKISHRGRAAAQLVEQMRRALI